MDGDELDDLDEYEFHLVEALEDGEPLMLDIDSFWEV